MLCGCGSAKHRIREVAALVHVGQAHALDFEYILSKIGHL